MNKIVLITIIFLIIPTVYAALCENRIDADTECLILTPVIDCNTSATILSNNGGLETKTMISVGNGIYNFTFKNVTGSYTIILCDNTTSQISVKETVDGKLDDLEVNVTKILSDIEDNQSQWITATGFATLQNTSDIRNDIGKLEDNLSDVADNVTEILVNLKDNQSQWITATGFETEGNASNRFTQVQENLSYIKSNLTTIISEVDFLEENVTTVLNLLRDATYGLEAIKNYLVSTIYSYLTTNIPLLSTQSNVTKIYDEINSINDSIIKQGDDISANITTLLDDNLQLAINQETIFIRLGAYVGQAYYNWITQTPREITGGNLTTQDWATSQNASDIRDDIADINTSDKTNYSRIATPESITSVNNTIKAVNVSIHSRIDSVASDVWGYGTRTLSSFGTLVADVWSYGTRVITGGVLTRMDWATLQNASDIRADIASLNTTINNSGFNDKDRTTLNTTKEGVDELLEYGQW